MVLSLFGMVLSLFVCSHSRGNQFVCCALCFDRGKPLLSMPRLRQVPKRRPRENPAAAKYRATLLVQSFIFLFFQTRALLLYA
jgi:hypothetical protein